MRLTILSILFLSFTTTIFAQNVADSAPKAQIAMVNMSLFYDKELGIKKLVQAKSLLIGKFHHNYRLQKLALEIERLEKEPHSLQIEKELVQLKIVEIEKLKIERNQEKDRVDALFKDEYNKLISPIHEKIMKKIKDFAKEKGYLIVLDKSSLTESDVIIEGRADDITSEFIKYCNESFDKWL